ncbi:hypothetical protein FKM82_002618 [Ascaphus truei]
MADPVPTDAGSKPPDLCPDCGQTHLVTENHIYNFQDEVDDELVCHICLQPLLQPMDTPCGHTYCYRCLENFLQERDFCPMDRKKLFFQNCRKSSLLMLGLQEIQSRDGEDRAPEWSGRDAPGGQSLHHPGRVIGGCCGGPWPL